MVEIETKGAELARHFNLDGSVDMELWVVLM
jgi:hypothetical protein